ncbi:MAG TPA: DUF554 domain-containing protein [Synergistaceae bacterium]|nr:DUF554 domain-containing protein [Synergistaceae bacterium]HPJ25265.1 DUF554 domain-containing protein [Synergistaceae bacterium]HPQ38327.1 DUF554 domain-containing protein [Synergistaceae bacterium]
MIELTQHIPLFGSLVNAGAIVAGTSVGLLAKHRFSQKYADISVHSLGLFTLVLGITLGIQTKHIMIVIFSLVLGSIIGQFLDLESLFAKAGDNLKKKLKNEGHTFTEGFVTASLLYCTGSMAVLGSFQEGLGYFPALLLAKSAMDGVISIAFAISLGLGVLFSAIPVFLYQGLLTLFAGTLQGVLSEAIITEISAVGGVLLVGVSLSILNIKHVQVMNMLPSMLLCGIIGYFFGI